MALICSQFYSSVYMGEPVDQADFPSLARRAEDAVGALTGYQTGLLSRHVGVWGDCPVWGGA